MDRNSSDDCLRKTAYTRKLITIAIQNSDHLASIYTISSDSTMSIATLNSFFQDLATEQETDCETLTIVVDNAHIPVHYSGPTEAFSRSLSAINSVPFPPPFLKETSRWESMEGSSNSDFSLSVPCRSRDDLDHNSLNRGRKNLGPSSSLDSTARLLRELPLECSPNSRTRRKKQSPLTPYVEPELPPLKECPYEEVETHPIVALRRLSETSESLEGNLSRVDLEIEEDEDSESGMDSEDESEDVSIPDDAFEEEEEEVRPEVEKVSRLQARFTSQAVKRASHENDWPNRKILLPTGYRRTFLDFPIPPTSPLRRSPKPADLAVVLEHELSVCAMLEKTGILEL